MPANRKKKVNLVDRREAQRKELLDTLRSKQPSRCKEFEIVCKRYGLDIEKIDVEFLKAGPSALEFHMKGLKLMQSRRRESAR